VICEEAWYDSVSILESPDSDDDLDNDFASVSGGTAQVQIPVVRTYSQTKKRELQFQTLRYLRSSFQSNPDPLPDVTGGSNAPHCKDAACFLDTMQLLRSIANAEACDRRSEQPDKSDDSNVAAAATSSGSCNGEECCSSSTLKELQAAMSPRPFPASIPSNKVQPMPIAGASPHQQQNKKKTAVVRLSFRTRSYEGDEMTETSELL
jgi:hypothetical protein